MPGGPSVPRSLDPALRRCRGCGAATSRASVTCAHCGIADPCLGQEREEVASLVSATEADLGAVAADTELAAQVSHPSVRWVQSWFFHASFLLWTGGSLLLAPLLGRVSPVLPFLVSTGVVLAAGWTVSRYLLPTRRERKTVFRLRAQAEVVRCGACGARGVPEVDRLGTWHCPFCNAKTDVVGKAAYGEARDAARVRRERAESSRHDALWDNLEHAILAPRRSWVFVLGIVAMIWAVVASQRALYDAMPTQAPYVGACRACTPRAVEPGLGPAGTELLIARRYPAEEGLLVFQGVETACATLWRRLLEGRRGAEAKGLGDRLDRARWSAGVPALPAEVAAFFSEVYGARASESAPLAGWRDDGLQLSIEGETLTWKVSLIPCDPTSTLAILE